MLACVAISEYHEHEGSVSAIHCIVSQPATFCCIVRHGHCASARLQGDTDVDLFPQRRLERRPLPLQRLLEVPLLPRETLLQLSNALFRCVRSVLRQHGVLLVPRDGCRDCMAVRKPQRLWRRASLRLRSSLRIELRGAMARPRYLVKKTHAQALARRDDATMQLFIYYKAPGLQMAPAAHSCGR